jgi:hypothetical protein
VDLFFFYHIQHQPDNLFIDFSFPPLDQPDQWAEIMQSFENFHGILNIVGAIDGTHVPLKMPSNDHWKGYINRKGWASLTFQCVVDGEGNFQNVNLAAGSFAFCVDTDQHVFSSDGTRLVGVGLGQCTTVGSSGNQRLVKA